MALERGGRPVYGLPKVFVDPNPLQHKVGKNFFFDRRRQLPGGTHPNDICCVPILRVEHDGRSPRSFQTQAEPLERNMIHIFGTLVGTGGLNMIQPPHHLNTTNVTPPYTFPLHGHNNVFRPIRFVANHEDNSHQNRQFASRDYIRRIKALCTSLGPPPIPQANPAALQAAHHHQQLIAARLREFSSKNLVALCSVTRFISLPDIDQRTLSLAYLLIENEVRRRNIIHNSKTTQGQKMFTISRLESEVWDRLRVQGLLQQEDITQLLPQNVQHFIPRVVFKASSTPAPGAGKGKHCNAARGTLPSPCPHRKSRR
jgi:hypothetical protein